MEPVDWEAEPGFIRAQLPNGDEYCSGIQYDGRILPSFENGCVARLHEIREKFESQEGDVLIYGYMKSGTHWLWEIIRMILEEDSSVSEKGSKMDSFIECISLEDIKAFSKPRILSSHLLPTGLPSELLKNSKVVVPIRHPKDTAVSLFCHLQAEKKGTELRCDWNTFLRDVWFNKDLALYATWTEFTSYVWNMCSVKDNFHPVIYEQLLEEPVEMIRDLAKFLGKDKLSDKLVQDIADATRFGSMKTKKVCSEKPLEKTFYSGYSMFRKGIKGEWRDKFTQEQNVEFDKKMKEISSHDENIHQVMMLYEDN
ncbi:sulfotransferase 6B1-like [Watersipora subatra]|uniref:sulfotransferase 6B1-like n=1 Tax=Watersipora subatra TaxID=2589382 RepID=UPI00355B246F